MSSDKIISEIKAHHQCIATLLKKLEPRERKRKPAITDERRAAIRASVLKVKSKY